MPAWRVHSTSVAFIPNGSGFPAHCLVGMRAARGGAAFRCGSSDQNPPHLHYSLPASLPKQGSSHLWGFHSTCLCTPWVVCGRAASRAGAPTLLTRVQELKSSAPTLHLPWCQRSPPPKVGVIPPLGFSFHLFLHSLGCVWTGCVHGGSAYVAYAGPGAETYRAHPALATAPT